MSSPSCEDSPHTLWSDSPSFVAEMLLSTHDTQVVDGELPEVSLASVCPEFLLNDERIEKRARDTCGRFTHTILSLKSTAPMYFLHSGREKLCKLKCCLPNLKYRRHCPREQSMTACVPISCMGTAVKVAHQNARVHSLQFQSFSTAANLR